MFAHLALNSVHISRQFNTTQHDLNLQEFSTDPYLTAVLSYTSLTLFSGPLHLKLKAVIVMPKICKFFIIVQRTRTEKR